MILEILMKILAWFLVLQVIGFVFIGCIAMCVGTYEIFTGKYNTLQKTMKSLGL